MLSTKLEGIMNLDNPNSNPSENLNAQTPDTNIESAAPNQNAPTETLYAGKYKSVDELVKGYGESSKYIRDLTSKVKEYEAKIPKAPEEYKFDFSNSEIKDIAVDPESQELKNMLPVFKELNLSNDQAQKIVETYIKTLSANVPSPEDIKRVLGPDAEIKIGRLQTFTGNLPAKDQEIMKSLTETPEGVDFLYRYLLNDNTSQSIPSNIGNGSIAGKTSKELYDEAFAYRDSKKETFDMDSAAKQHYENLMLKASKQALLENQKK